MIFKRQPTVATIAVNLRPRNGSWGGANQWAVQVTRAFEYNNWKVRYDLSVRPDAILMTHTGLSPHTTFGADDVERLKSLHGAIPCIHRINDNDIRKGTGEMDRLLERSNQAADYTVFVSEWLREHHSSRWFDVSKPHSVILPGADPRYFHSLGGQRHREGVPFRLVTHHWSDNWNKGFDVYRDIDRLIDGPLRGAFELWIIGRWPVDLQWRSARTLPPASGAALAGLLRQCHGYVSASRFEPGAMHVAEGLQCGLPLLYHGDSGGTVEQGRKYGLEIGEDLLGTLHAFARDYEHMRARVLGDPPSGSKMAFSYVSLAEKLLANA